MARSKKRATAAKPERGVVDAPNASASTRTKSRSVSRGRGPAWTFPKESLEAAIRVARAIDEKHGGHPMGAADLAKAVGFRQSNDWRFLDLLRAANQYGLVSGSGAGATVRLEKLG